MIDKCAEAAKLQTMTSMQLGSRLAAVKRLSLRGIALILLCGFAIFPIWFPLIPHYRGQLSDVRTFAPTLSGGLLYGAVLSGLFAVCWFGYRRALRIKQLPTLQWLLSWSALFGFLLLFTYPVNANDVFRYFLRGRVAMLHGENPYLVAPNAFPDDPYLALGGEWIDTTSPYGPLWEMVDAAIVGLAASNLLASLLGFKLVGLLAVLGCGWTIYQLLEDAPERVRFGRTLLWLWNPAVMLMFVVDAHNDALMLFWLLLGLLQMCKHGRVRLGLWLMVVAVLTKATAIVALGIFGIAALGRQATWAERAKLLLWWAVGVVIITAVSIAPYGNVSGLVTRLFEEAGASGGFSPLVMAYFIGQQVDSLAFDFVPAARILSFVFIGIAIFFAGWTGFGREASRSSADSYFAYLLTALKFRIWYTLWVFPWLLLDHSSEKRLLFGFLLLVTSQLSVVHYVYGLRFVYGGSMPIAHFIGIPFVFGVPILVTFVYKYAKFGQKMA